MLLHAAFFGQFVQAPGHAAALQIESYQETLLLLRVESALDYLTMI